MDEASLGRSELGASAAPFVKTCVISILSSFTLTTLESAARNVVGQAPLDDAHHAVTR